MLGDAVNVAAEQLAVAVVDENCARAEADDGVAIGRNALIEARKEKSASCCRSVLPDRRSLTLAPLLMRPIQANYPDGS